LPRVLIIEDEAAIRQRMAKALTFEGYDTLEAEDGRIGLDLIPNHRPDLVLTDLMMPHVSGNAVVAAIRSQPSTRLTPVIVITARDDRATQRHLMTLGADDFITKPVTVEELIGAVSAQLRKHCWQTEERREGKRGTEYRFGDWRFNTVRRKLAGPSGHSEIVPPAEAKLLTALLEHPKEVMSRDMLFKRIGRASSSPFDRHVDVLIARLRQRIRPDRAASQPLETVWGQGYVLNATVVPEHGRASRD